MILDLLLVPIMLIVNGVLYLLPAYNGLPTGLQTFLNLIGTNMKYLGLIFPLDVIRNCTLVMGTAITAYLALHIGTFVANLLPGLKPFGRGNPGVGYVAPANRIMLKKGNVTDLRGRKPLRSKYPQYKRNGGTSQ